jgi:hypothetical protein
MSPSDDGRALACALATELLIELHAAAGYEVFKERCGARLADATRACQAIIEELAAGRVRLEPVEVVTMQVTKITRLTPAGDALPPKEIP